MRIFTQEFIEKMGKALPEVEPINYMEDATKYSAVVEIGSWHIQLTNKTFTKRQIKHMKKYFGWEVRNIDES